MGYGESRLHFVAPGWELFVEQIVETARTWEGRPVRLVGTRRCAGSRAPSISPSQFSRYLVSIGFAESNEPMPGSLRREEVLIEPWISEKELTGRTFELKLAQDSNARIKTWRALSEVLSRKWNSVLWDSRSSSGVPISEFDRILKSTLSWRDWAARFHWDEQALP